MPLEHHVVPFDPPPHLGPSQHTHLHPLTMATYSTPLRMSPTRSMSSDRTLFVDSPMDSAFAADVQDDIQPASQSQLPATSAAETWGEQKRVWISASNEQGSTADRHRTIILCFDGTGDQFDGDNSNVVQLLAMLKKNDNSQQLVYYQAGIGTYTDPIFQTPLAFTVSLVLDSMLAWNFGSHVKDGYVYLMQNYTRGDKICIFGFSRGAYTARALAGMLQKVGLLPVSNYQQVPFAYDMYTREDEEGLLLSHMFKKTFCRSVRVEFLGVWDTVASIGLVPRYLPFIHENTGIRYLRHALALDERRVKFLPQFCVDKPESIKLKEEKAHFLHHPFQRKPKRAQTLSKAYENLINEKNASENTDVQEVWFAGVHTDVGGGSVPNGTRNSLARIPLRWMIRECFRCNTGIIFDAAQLQQTGFRVTMEDGRPILGDLPPRISVPYVHPLPKRRPSTLVAACKGIWDYIRSAFLVMKAFLLPKKKYPGALPVMDLEFPDRLMNQDEDYEAHEEYEDALSPAFDQLAARIGWHILEWIPQHVKKQKAILQKFEDGDSYKWLWNRGMGRKIPRSEIREGLKVHRSVKTRLEAAEKLGEHYVPQVRPMIEQKFRDPVTGKKVKKEPRRLTYEEWNVENPVYWQWVD